LFLVGQNGKYIQEDIWVERGEGSVLVIASVHAQDTTSSPPDLSRSTRILDTI
jgi:hypothetical protein